MGENLATILEFLRKHHFVKAEAALREELAHRQKGNNMIDEADQNLILKLRSMEDAVDTTGNPSFLSLAVAGRVSSEAQTGKPSTTSVSFNSESQWKPIKPAETVLGESNGLFSLYSHSLEGEGRGGSGSRQSNSEAEEPLEFWTIKEIQAAELPAEESESDEVLHDNLEEGRRRRAQSSKDYGNAMANPCWDDAFEEEEEEEDDLSLLRLHSSDAGFHSKKLLPPFRNGSPPPLPSSLLERVASTSGENAVRDTIVGLVEEEVWQNGKRKGVPLKTLLPPLPFRLPLESSESLTYTAQEGIRVAPNNSHSRADNPALVSISGPPTEGLPRLPPVKLHTPEKKGRAGGLHVVEVLGVGTSTRSLESDAFQSIGSITPPLPEGDFRLGTLLDIPFSQESSSSGAKRLVARPSISQGITEEAFEHLTGFASASNEMDKDFPDEYWDSDTYEDDDDPGYIRQPIEDEAWFLANEIDYPSDDERSRNRAENNHNLYAEYGNLEDENNSLVEEESFFSGEEYYRSKGSDLQKQDRSQLAYESMYSRNSDCDDDVALRLRDAECFDLGRPEALWSGFAGQSSGTGSQIKEVIYDDECQEEEIDAEDDDRHGSTRSGGFGVNSDAAEMGSEVRENILWGSSEGDLDQDFIVRESDYTTRIGPSGGYCNTFPERGDLFAESATAKSFVEEREDLAMSSSYHDEIGGQRRPGRDKQVLETETLGQDRRDSDVADQLVLADNHVREGDTIGGISLGGFSFLPSNTGDVIASREESGKSLWIARDSGDQDEDADDYGKGRFGPDDTLAAWKRKSNDSSPIVSTMDENLLRMNSLKHPAVSTHSADVLSGMQEGSLSLDGQNASTNQQGAETIAPEDEDAIAEQEQIRRMGMEEDEYEVFDLRIIHRKNRTGFEEEKDLPVVLNSIIAGRYHATEYLGSAAFSKAIQAHDVHTGMDVCMKIIKNNKDFFDQSLDEIKLLKYVNKHDPADKHHILRLYDYFYHREHLFIVCELLRANLYEFQKFNRESGGEVYFTMPRLQSIARQCLEALEFLHGLGLIHCDLKPENILVKSYSRCEIKVIDLGSSCFQTDHLCSYVQSRSYRAPEVILGLPYDQKIDIWSLGCILAELCSGNVLFQNDSIATLLARVVGILGPADPEMLAKGKDSHKYFTKNHMLYERNQENDRLEYLIPKKTSLSHRLPMGDKEFVAFVGFLLQANPNKRPTASEALNHQWLSFPYEPISS